MRLRSTIIGLSTIFFCLVSSMAHAGGVTNEQIEATIDGHMPEIHACYRAALQRDASTTGEIRTLFVVAPDGTITSERTRRPPPGVQEILDSEFIECVRAVMRSIRFPASGETSRVITYPFRFSQEAGSPQRPQSFFSCNIVETVLSLWSNAESPEPTSAAERCEWDDANACFQIALAAHKEGKQDHTSVSNIFRNYRKACDLYHATACNNLAVAILGGLFGTEDVDSRALPYFQRGCDYGSLGACVSVGIRLVSGKGVEMDVPSGSQILKDSCRLGEPAACRHVGVLMLSEDAIAAHGLFSKACELDDRECDIALRLGLLQASAQTALRTRVQQVCLAKSPVVVRDHCFVAGLMHACGFGGARDLQGAQALMERACRTPRNSHTCSFLSEFLKERGDVSGSTSAARIACEAGGGIGCSLLANAIGSADEQQVLAQKGCVLGHKRACDGVSAIRGFSLNLCEGVTEYE